MASFFSKDQSLEYACTHNTQVNLFQFATYIFIDLIPVYSIVLTHHKNWKECVHESQESFVYLD